MVVLPPQSSPGIPGSPSTVEADAEGGLLGIDLGVEQLAIPILEEHEFLDILGQSLRLVNDRSKN